MSIIGRMKILWSAGVECYHWIEEPFFRQHQDRGFFFGRLIAGKHEDDGDSEDDMIGDTNCSAIAGVIKHGLSYFLVSELSCKVVPSDIAPPVVGMLIEIETDDGSHWQLGGGDQQKLRDRYHVTRVTGGKE
jgi:hypothetical protein